MSDDDDVAIGWYLPPESAMDLVWSRRGCIECGGNAPMIAWSENMRANRLEAENKALRKRVEEQRKRLAELQGQYDEARKMVTRLEHVVRVGGGQHPCSFCHATGYVGTNLCQECRGSGQEPR